MLPHLGALASQIVPRDKDFDFATAGRLPVRLRGRSWEAR
jgi:hypothetical protein